MTRALGPFPTQLPFGRILGGTALLVGSALSPGPAAAQDAAGDAEVAVAACRPDGEGPLLLLGFEGTGWPEALVGETRALFRAQARSDGFEVCDARARRMPDTEVAARLTVERRPGGDGGEGEVVVTLIVADEITRKRVARDLDLSAFPEDSQAVALAAAGDELLRASWMELAMGAEVAPSPAPPEVRAVVEREVAPRPSPRVTLGARFAVEVFGGGERHLGGDAVLTVWPIPWLAVEVDVGWRTGLEERSPNGSVRATVVSSGLAFLARLVDAGTLRLALGLGGRVAGIRYAVAPLPGSVGRDDGGILGTVRGGPVVLWSPGSSIELRVAVLGGYPVRGVAARDDGTRSTAVSDWELAAQLGVGARF